MVSWSSSISKQIFCRSTPGCAPHLPRHVSLLNEAWPNNIPEGRLPNKSAGRHGQTYEQLGQASVPKLKCSETMVLNVKLRATAKGCFGCGIVIKCMVVCFCPGKGSLENGACRIVLHHGVCVDDVIFGESVLEL